MAKPPFKPLRLAPAEIETERRADGTLILRSRTTLLPYPRSIGELLRYWAREAGARTLLAERERRGQWRRVGYGEALAIVERLAASLLERGLGTRRPLAILSDNGVDAALLALAGMHVGIPVVPVSPAYSLLSRDHAQLKHVFALIEPGLVYASNGAKFERAIAAALPAGCELAVSADPPRGRPATEFDALLSAEPGASVERAFAEVGPDTVAKILFTSGSTGRPKGVINTQRMLLSNQQAIAQVWPFLEERPPVLVDWLPWNHTFGGNHNFNLVIRNGGTLYIDGGKPAPGLVEITVANLAEIAPTVYFNVPRGYDMLIPYLERDEALRENFFRDLDMIFYAGASLPQHLWDRLERLAIETTGRRVVMLAAWGSTETAPSATKVHFPIERPGIIGLPGPGIEIKLAPVGDKLELRVKGPCLTPGYWRQPELNEALFDEEGFLKMGDAGKLADPSDPSKGILFDGRLAENFKLTSGNWVQVGELRTELVAALAPIAQDIVLTGHDRASIGLLVFPNPAGCRALCREAASDTPLQSLIARSEVRRHLAASLAAHNAANPASSRRVGAALILAEPPSIDAGEITDKGYINQRAVLERRAHLVERLNRADEDDAELIFPEALPAAAAT